MSRRDNVLLMLMQALAAMNDPRPRTTPEFGAPPPTHSPQPFHVGDEPETVFEQVRRERRRLIEVIQHNRQPRPHRRRPAEPWGVLGRGRAPGPQGMSEARTRMRIRPSLTRGGGRTGHRLGYATFGTMMFILELGALGHLFWAARSPHERVALAAGFGLEVGLEYMALRYIGAFAAAPMHALFLQGDSSDLEERELEAWLRREWPYHVQRIAVDLAHDLQSFDRLLVDTEDVLSHVDSMTDPAYLTRRLTELSNAFLDTYDLLIDSVTQLSADDLPAVRAKLIAMGVDGELVQDMI